MKTKKSKKRMTAMLITLVLFMALMISLTALGVFSETSEYPVLTLYPTDSDQAILSGPANSNGYKIHNVGLNGGTEEGTVTFPSLPIPKDGEYTLRIYYYSGSDDRYFIFTHDGEKKQIDCPSTGSFDTEDYIDVTMFLKAGKDLVIGSDWYGPDLGYIELYSEEDIIIEDKEYTDPDNVEYSNGNTTLILDKNNGVFSVKYANAEELVVKNVHSEVIVNDALLSSDEFTTHTVEAKEDGGKTVEVVFTHTGNSKLNGVTVKDVFTLKEGYYTVKTVVSSENELSTNHIAVFAGFKDAVKVENGVFMKMPFDNDKWEEPRFFSVEKFPAATTGYEVGAIFSQEDNYGFVFGSIEHDTWKTGIDISAQAGTVATFEMYAGASDSFTRDKWEHGYVSGKEIASPEMFIGVFEDWRAGLITYGAAMAEATPPRPGTTGTSFGFNSWATYGSGVSYSQMVAVSDYIKDNLQTVWEENGECSVYVNIDSYWDHITANDDTCNMTLDEALASFVKICKDNGQKPGIYFTPFATWHDEEGLRNSVMEGSDYTYYDAALRMGPDNELYGKELSDGYALDATHPGTIARIEDRINYFIDLGFEYLKLDFLTHGALEGNHYAEGITTGMQAYNYGMKKIAELTEGKMFVNLSISPMFPYQYADGRRISCDAFANIDATKHVLSYLTAGFWMGEVYKNPDPDHLLVLGESLNVAKCRVTSGIISGASFLIGDDLAGIAPDSSDAEFLKTLYGNKDIIRVAKMGKMFLPYSVTPGARCADTFYYTDGEKLYVVMYNLEKTDRDVSLNLTSILPWDSSEEFYARDLWADENVFYALEGTTLSAYLYKEDVALFEIQKGKDPSAVTEEPTETEGSEETTPAVTPGTTTTPTTPEITEEPEKDENSFMKFLPILIIIIVVAIGTEVAVIIINKNKKKKQ